MGLDAALAQRITEDDWDELRHLGVADVLLVDGALGQVRAVVIFGGGEFYWTLGPRPNADTAAKAAHMLLHGLALLRAAVGGAVPYEAPPTDPEAVTAAARAVADAVLNWRWKREPEPRPTEEKRRRQLGEGLRAARTTAGFTQEALAERLGRRVTAEMVADFEAGRTSMYITADLWQLLGAVVDSRAWEVFTGPR